MNFVIVCSQRTGSTLLTQLLDQRQDVLCNGAIFESGPGRMPVRWAKDPNLIAELCRLRNSDPGGFLARVQAEKQGCQSVGFKICPGHNDSILDKLLMDPAIGKILLIRQNVLAVYSSAMIARRTGERRATAPGAGADSETRIRVEFEPRKFMRFWERYSAFFRIVIERLNASGQVFHLIHYTEINDPWYFGRVLAFLGVEQSRDLLYAKNKKQNSSDILSRFSNPEQTMEFLAQHRMMSWCYESDTSLEPGMAVRA